MIISTRWEGWGLKRTERVNERKRERDLLRGSGGSHRTNDIQSIIVLTFQFFHLNFLRFHLLTLQQTTRVEPVECSRSLLRIAVRLRSV